MYLLVVWIVIIIYKVISELVDVSFSRFAGVDVLPGACGGLVAKEGALAPLVMHATPHPLPCWEVRVLGALVLRT